MPTPEHVPCYKKRTGHREKAEWGSLKGELEVLGRRAMVQAWSLDGEHLSDLRRSCGCRKEVGEGGSS
jgi:hypothetical protein